MRALRRSDAMKGGELAENEERAVGLALVLSTFVRKKEVEVKEVEVKEEKVMEGIKTADLQVNALVQQERSRANITVFGFPSKISLWRSFSRRL